MKRRKTKHEAFPQWYARVLYEQSRRGEMSLVGMLIAEKPAIARYFRHHERMHERVIAVRGRHPSQHSDGQWLRRNSKKPRRKWRSKNA